MVLTELAPVQTCRDDDDLPTWLLVFRRGIAPALSLAALTALAEALRRDDRRLIQGAASVPPPLQCMAGLPLECGCAITLAVWLGDGVATVDDAEAACASVCVQCDRLTGEEGAFRWFLNGYDDCPRPQMLAELLTEVLAELGRRVPGRRKAGAA